MTSVFEFVSAWLVGSKPIDSEYCCKVSPVTVIRIILILSFYMLQLTFKFLLGGSGVSFLTEGIMVALGKTNCDADILLVLLFDFCLSIFVLGVVVLHLNKYSKHPLVP